PAAAVRGGRRRGRGRGHGAARGPVHRCRRTGRAGLRLRRRLRRLTRPEPVGGTGPHVRARPPLRLARHPRRDAPVVRGTDLRQPRAGVRAAQHALAEDHPALPAGPAGRAPGRLARRADLGRAAGPAVASRRVSLVRRADPGEGHHAAAQCRQRAHAARPAVPRRGRRAHRPGDRGQGPQPRGRRRAGARGRDRLLVRDGFVRRARRVHRNLPAARLAGTTFLVVDDLDAAQGPGRRPVRPAPATVPAAVRDQLEGGGDVPRRELRGAAAVGPWLVAVVLVALNLRTPIASVPPLADTIAAALHLGGAATGLLTTLPVVCMGLFAPVGALASRRFGRERVLAAAVALIAAGTAVRAVPSAAVLYASAVLAGTGIAVAGALLPPLVRARFPGRVGPVTGVYTAGLIAGAMLAAALTEPARVRLGGSWPLALAAWAVPAAGAPGGRTARRRARLGGRQHADARRRGGRPRRRAVDLGRAARPRHGRAVRAGADRPREPGPWPGGVGGGVGHGAVRGVPVLGVRSGRGGCAARPHRRLPGAVPRAGRRRHGDPRRGRGRGEGRPPPRLAHDGAVHL